MPTYTRRLKWLRPTILPDAAGAEPTCFSPADQRLWGNIVETGGYIDETGASRQTGAQALITINGAPAVTTKDRLEDSYGYVWTLDTIVNSDGCLTIQAHRYDFLTDFRYCE